VPDHGICGTISVATWNIRSGRNGGLEAAGRALRSANVDIAVLQETKLTRGIYTRQTAGYRIVATDAQSCAQGGVAVCWREENERFEVEEVRIRHANIITFEIQTGTDRYYAVGCYIPPTDRATFAHVQGALQQCPAGCQLLLLGDLNVDLESPRRGDEREGEIVEGLDAAGLTDVSCHFTQRRKRIARGRWTWRQRRLGRWVSSRPDYFMASDEVRGKFRRVGCRTLRHHDSDHRAIVGRLYAGRRGKLRRYRKRRQRFPVALPRAGPRTHGEALFEELKGACEPPPARQRPANAWISDATWVLVDRRAALRRGGWLSQAASRRLGRQINSQLKADRQQRVEDVADKIEGHLAAGELAEAWGLAKGWYRSASERAPKPCRQTLARQTDEREELYGMVIPPGTPIPINVDAFDINDDVPGEAEIRAAVRRLRSGRAGGASGIRAEHIKKWLAATEAAEKEGTDPGDDGDRWKLFVELVQLIFEKGEIPSQMTWVMVVLLPKGNDDYRGIGLIEPFQKVVQIIVSERLGAIELHDSLHGFVAERGTGTAIIELKLAQQLAHMEQEPLFATFLDLRKAYDAICRGRCLRILQGYGVGPRVLEVIAYFWVHMVCVCKAGGCFGRPFRTRRGATQGGPDSPRIFNVLIDAIVREWLRQTLGVEAARVGLSEEDVRKLLALFYADDGVLASRDAARLQSSQDILVGLFERVGLDANATKTQCVTFVPGKIRTRLSNRSYTQQQEGVVSPAEWQRRQVECDVCGDTMQRQSLYRHLETQHDIFRSRVIDRDLLLEHEEETFTVWQSPEDGQFHCPVPACIGLAQTPWNLRRHFADRHPWHLVGTPQEGVYPRCEECGMQTNPERFGAGHEDTADCVHRAEKRRQHAAAVTSQKALEQRFSLNGKELEQVEAFRYLGRLVAFDDNDARAVNSNLRKARKCWMRLSRLLRAENASPRVCGMFFKAVVMAVLLYGSESWSITPAALKRLEGFVIRAAYRMARANKPRRNPDGTWVYPATSDVRAEVGLYSVDHYIRKRRNTIAQFLAGRPLHDLVMDARRQRGSPRHQYWWSQPMCLEGEEAD